MLTENKIIESLKSVIDPELNFDIVKLGLIRTVEIGEYFEEIKSYEYIKIIITLTTPMCPFADIIISDIRDNITELCFTNDVKSEINIDVSFDPPWTCPEDIRLEMGV
jgi:metal-sulfur cluster biosynthetic enzyme